MVIQSLQCTGRQISGGYLRYLDEGSVCLQGVSALPSHGGFRIKNATHFLWR